MTKRQYRRMIRKPIVQNIITGLGFAFAGLLFFLAVGIATG